MRDLLISASHSPSLFSTFQGLCWNVVEVGFELMSARGCRYVLISVVNHDGVVHILRCVTVHSRTGTRSLATVTEAPASSSSTVLPRVVKGPDGEQATIHTAVLLSRSPIISRTHTKFERAYYAYQARIDRALHNPLPYEFHFKPNSPLEVQFDKEEFQREKKAFCHALWLCERQR